MHEINDDQRWIYPMLRPTFPQDPGRHFMPFFSRPMGDENYRHTTVLSFMGRGPKGAQGDALTYEMLTDEQKIEIVELFGTLTIDPHERYRTLENGDNTFDLKEIFDNHYDPDMVLYVDINGLDLILGKDYVYDLEEPWKINLINGAQIVSHDDEEFHDQDIIHFRMVAMRVVSDRDSLEK